MTNELIGDIKRKILTAANANGISLLEEKPISYGCQLTLGKGLSTIPVNIYYSKKKGVSTVVGGSPQSPLHQEIIALVNTLSHNSDSDHNRPERNNDSQPPAKSELAVNKQDTFHNWDKWIGTDESGKGDFFGPLVVSGFVADRIVLPELMSIGVRDSKKVSDKEIVTISHEIYRLFAERAEVIILKPETYNKLYADFSRKGKKTNELMGWMHGRLLLNLKKKFEINNALVDKFAADKVLTSSLQDLKDMEITQVPKAESDIAVAAASILARYHFLRGLHSLSQKFNMTFPKGAGEKTISAGKTFVVDYSATRLPEVAKINFRTYDIVLGNKVAPKKKWKQNKRG